MIFLKYHKLRFGIVLNHKEMRFELWLMGRNSDIQKKYWEILKHSKWNADKNEMPKYSVLEVILEDQIDFDAKEIMTKNIIEKSVSLALEIQDYLNGREE